MERKRPTAKAGSPEPIVVSNFISYFYQVKNAQLIIRFH
jgi:hypothetical protein